MNEFISETTEVRVRHKFDISSMENFMRENVEGFSGRLTVRQFTHGQSNPTFILSDGNTKYVMRKKPPGRLLPSAHAVDREYRIISALQDTDVPTPKSHALCEDDTIIGTAFYIMELVEGRIFRDVMAEDVASVEERSKIFDSLNHTLAKIHMVDLEATGLSDYGKPGNYMARQVSRWSKQYEAAKTSEIESMDNLIRWLPDHIPSDDSTSIVHGDFRLENMIVHPTEPKIVAVLDWEISTLGHPLADLAYTCMNYHIPATDDKRLGFVGANFEELGIPTEEEFISTYCKRTGRSLPGSDWNFFLAFSIFRLASIVQGVYKRGLDGIASSESAQMFGDYVKFFSDLGWQIAEKDQ